MSLSAKTATVGTGAGWVTPDNVGSVVAYAISTGPPFESDPDYFNNVHITLDGIGVEGNNGSIFQLWTEADTDETFGGSTNLWGRSWVLADIKDNSNFGVRVDAVDGSAISSDFLFAIGFDFSTIPDGSTINGVAFTINRKHVSAEAAAYVNNVRCTVYYTEPVGGGEISHSFSIGGGMSW